MYLCDIGNSNVHLSHEGREWTVALEKFHTFSTTEELYYINVNSSMEEVLKGNKNYINLAPYLELDTIYQGMGIDRVAACYTINDGIVIDAGSAITVDIMSNGLHLGGYILPGLSASLETYRAISPALDIRLNKNIYFTGGDGKFFSRFFKRSIYDKSLVFRGMQKALNESGLLEGIKC
jgi:type III pantothenate kinase